MEMWKVWWGRLTAPIATLPLPESHQARLLASLILFCLVVGTVLQTAVVILSPVEVRTNFVWRGITVGVTLFFLYWLSRTPYYRIAGGLAVLAIATLIYVNALQPAQPALILIYLVLPILLSSIFVTLRVTLLFTAISAIGLFLILTRVAKEDAILLVGPFTFYVLTSGILALAAQQRRRFEHERRVELVQSEMLFRTLSEKALVGIYIIQDGLLRYVNPALAEIFGYRVEEIVDRLSPTDLVVQEDQDLVAQNVRRRLNKEVEVSHYFLRGRRKDGSLIYCEVLGRRTDYHGRPAIIGTLLDITERRQAEEALRESERLYRTLFESTPIGLGIANASGKLIAVNEAMLQPGGYERDELLTMESIAALCFTDAEQRQLATLLQLEETNQFPVHLQRKDGGCYDAFVSLVPIVLQGEPCWQVVVQDVTERKKAEKAEREQRVLAEALRDTATVLNSTLNLDQVLERILDNVGRVVPHDGANIMLFHGDEARVVRCQGLYEAYGLVEQMLTLRFSLKQMNNFGMMARTRHPYVVPDTHKDPGWVRLPETKWVRSYVGAPISRSGEVIGFLNLDSLEPDFFNHVHAERLQAFADQVAIALQNARLYQELESYSETLEHAVTSRTLELRRAVEQVEVILNNSPDAILLLREDGTVRAANPAFYEMFGFSEADTLQRPVQQLVSPATADIFVEALDAVIENGEKRRLEVAAQRKDGSTFDADVALAPVKEDDAVRGGVCSVRDISRLKEVDRMKDAFVSNVSHELRTPITSLRLYHDLLMRNPQRNHIYLQRLEREIDRLNAIIEDLLRLSRLDRGRVDMTLQDVDVNQLVEQYLNDRMPLAETKGISLRWQLAPEAPLVQADRSLLEQVLGILLTNAFNYTPAGGEVVVTVQEATRGGSPWLTCRVQDTGRGIAPGEQAYLFDRFYRGEAAQASGTPGTGLGLAIAQEIIERHHGFIDVESEGVPGKGSKFTIWLPTDCEETAPVATTASTMAPEQEHESADVQR